MMTAASRFMLPLVVDETADKPAFTIGIKKQGSAPENGFFGKEYGSFIKTGPYLMRKLRDEDTSITKEDYTGMKVRSFNNYKIGMSASYNGKSMVICAKSASTEGSEIVFTYILGTKELYGPQKTYSHTLHGRCLEGKVVKCENERVKLQLDIDVKSGNTKPEGELYWFNWQPETGNLMYCMPEKDTVVSLYIGSTDEGEAIVINSLRKDKGKDIDDPKKRYLTSLDKKRMLLKEKEMGFSMEDKDDGKTHIKLMDDKEIIFKTDKKVVIQADGKIVMAAKKVNADAKKAVNVVQKSTGINIDDKINIKASMTYMGFGGGVAELPKKAEKLKLKKKPRQAVKIVNTGKSTSGKLLSGAAEAANNKFRGDQFDSSDSFDAAFGEPDRTIMTENNSRMTCPLDANLKGKFKDNSQFAKQVPEAAQKKIAEARAASGDIKSGTVMQKVIPKKDFERYLSGEKNNMTGCTSKASDAAPFTGNEAVSYESLRLDYEGTSFSNAPEKSGNVYVLRCTSSKDIKNSEYPMVTPDQPWNNPPCTGTGILGGDEHLIPEYTCGANGVPISDGAIYSVDKDGNEYIAAVWNKRKRKFVKVK